MADIILEATKKTKYPRKTEKQLLAEADKYIKHSSPEVRRLGNAIKHGIATSFSELNELFAAINALLFVGGQLLALTIGTIMATILLIVSVVPFVLISGVIRNQRTFLQSVLKKTDPNVKKYFSFTSDIIDENISIVSESEFVLEAPNEVTADDDEDTTDYTNDVSSSEDEPTDYTDSVNSNEDEPEDVESEEQEEPDDNQEDNSNDNKPAATSADGGEDEAATDYTADVQSDDDEPEDATTGDTDTGDDADTGATDDDDTVTDYTDDVSNTDSGDAGDEEPADDSDVDGDADSTNDDTSDESPESDETGEDNSSDENSNVKNYNLMCDLNKLYHTISNILTSLGDVIYKQPIQNQVLVQGIKNLQTLKDQILNYMEFNFTSEYKSNLYYYTVFVQVLRLNLELLKKNSQLGESNENN